MLSVPRERRLDPVTVEILQLVDAVARDLAVAMPSWREFETMKARLVGTAAFQFDERITQRLYHVRSTGGRGYPLDLIPFGGVEREGSAIAWPPDGVVVMNVAGYAEVFASAVPVELDPGFTLRVASLAGLAILKVVAWAERGAGDPRDAIDFATLLREYGRAGNEDRLYDAEIGILETVDYDFDLAGARLLGVDAGRIAAPSTQKHILTLLDDPACLDRRAPALRAPRKPIALTEGVTGKRD